MERSEVIATLESIANGIDPADGERIPLEVFHRTDTVRALFTAASWLKDSKPRNASLGSAGNAWSAEEDAQLRREFGEERSIAQIARQHGRSSKAITARLVKFGLMQETAVKRRAAGVIREKPTV